MIMRKWLSGLAFGVIAGAFIMGGPTDISAQDAKKDAQKKGKKKAGMEKGPQKELTASPSQAMISVSPKPSPVPAVAAQIDALIDSKLREQKLTPSPRCTDEEFVRRASIDITGVVPTADKVRNFLESKDADKRAKLVDELLASPKFGTRQADVWVNLLYPRESDNRFVGKEPLVEWIKESLNSGKPWNKLVYEMLTVNGTTDEHKEAVYFLSNRTVDKLTDSVSKVFMGLQLQCAQCHNHPFSDWTQKEYWGLAQFFMKVQTGNPRAAAQGGEAAGVSEVASVRRNDKNNPLPESAKAVKPKFPAGEEISFTPGEPARPALAKWLTDPKNAYFSKALVNREWFLFFGRGLVDPVDNMDEEKKSPFADVLGILAKEFTQSGYDMKHLIRVFCASDAYQRSSRPSSGNGKDHVYYSHQEVKVLAPEQLFDSLAQVLDFSSAKGAKQDMKIAGGQKGQPRDARGQFVAFFQGTETAKPVEYEAGIPQALRLMNNAKINPRTTADKIAKNSLNGDQVIEQLYLTALARKPSSVELEKMKAFVAKAPSKNEGYGDILWALVNSSEFALNK